MLTLSQIAAIIGLSIALSIVALIIAFRLLITPELEALILEKTKEAQEAISKGMSALGDKGRKVRDTNKMEGMMLEDILAEYPEIQIALDFFRPELADDIRENPEIALRIIQKYKPMIDEILGARQGPGGARREIYDL